MKTTIMGYIGFGAQDLGGGSVGISAKSEELHTIPYLHEEFLKTRPIPLA